MNRARLNVNLRRLMGRRNGLTAEEKSFGARLSSDELERIRELQQIWLKSVLQIISSANGSQSVVIGVTSPDRSEGKTTTCLGFASALAREAAEPVVIVECDLASPSIAEQLDLADAPGLTEYVKGEADAENIIQRTSIEGVDVIVAGGSGNGNNSGAGGDVWDTLSLSELRRELPNTLELLRQMYRFVVLDMPPVLTNAYTAELGKNVDKMYMAAKSGVTDNERLVEATQVIAENTEIAGIILTGSASTLPAWLNRMIKTIE